MQKQHFRPTTHVTTKNIPPYTSTNTRHFTTHHPRDHHVADAPRDDEKAIRHCEAVKQAWQSPRRDHHVTDAPRDDGRRRDSSCSELLGNSYHNCVAPATRTPTSVSFPLYCVRTLRVLSQLRRSGHKKASFLGPSAPCCARGGTRTHTS